MILSDFLAARGEWALAVVVAGFVLAAIITAGLIRLFLKRKLLDIPNQRSNHVLPTPRGGGLAIILLVVPVLFYCGAWVLALGMMVLAAVSFADDMRPLPARMRFMAQILVVGAVLSVMPAFTVTGFLPSLVEKIILGVCWLWFMNLFNFMDGADGLAGFQSAFLAAGIVLLAEAMAEGEVLILLVLCGASLGFLLWNWHPAKIFMGDVGSVPIGFLLGYFLVALILRGYAPAAFILPAYYVADATFTLLHRVWKKENIATAHSSHCYQRAIRRGMKHNVMVKWVGLVNSGLLFLAIFSINTPFIWLSWIAVFPAYLGAFVCMIFFAGIKQEQRCGI